MYLLKRIISIICIAVFFSNFLIAQSTSIVADHLTKEEYVKLKMSGNIPTPTEIDYHGPYPRVLVTHPQNEPSGTFSATTSNSLKIPLDNTFSVVPFVGASLPEYRNDDGSSSNIPLQFTFSLFGDTYNEVYINTNGNISFGSAYFSFSPVGFPNSDFVMVAPFWADVDISNQASGLVYYKSEPNRFTVTWDRVFYFGGTTTTNTFQVIITDGTDPLIGLGNNICFSYGDMQWTGWGGFNSFAPATVGANRGNGSEFFLVGRFDHPGNDYDGPGGNADGVDYLDGSEVCFNASDANIPPIPQGFPAGNTVELDAETTLNLNVLFISPENNQTTSVIVDDGGLTNFSASISSGNPATVDITFSPTNAQSGTHEITFTATDDGDPQGITTVTLMIQVNSTISAHSPYTLFATERVSGSKFALVEGDIHSNEEVELKSGKNGVVNGNITAVEEIEIDKKNIVNGDVTAPEVDNDGTVNGTVSEGPVDPADFPVIPPFTAGTQDVEVDKGDTYLLPPGSYGEIEVDKNATLMLTAGDYYADELELKDKSTLEVDVSGGAVNVYLEGEIDHRKKAEVVVIGGSTELFTLYTLANKYVKIRGTFRGNLIAPNVKDVRLEKNAYFMGAMCASQISLKQGSVAVPHGSSTLPKVLAGDGDEDPASVVPTDYALEQNYPNPFNPTTTIRFNLPAAASVTLKVFNVGGQLVKTLYSGELSAGSHQLQWDATNELGQKVTSGVYFYQLQSRDFRQVRKMMLMK